MLTRDNINLPFFKLSTISLYFSSNIRQYQFTLRQTLNNINLPFIKHSTTRIYLPFFKHSTISIYLSSNTQQYQFTFLQTVSDGLDFVGEAYWVLKVEVTVALWERKHLFSWRCHQPVRTPEVTRHLYTTSLCMTTADTGSQLYLLGWCKTLFPSYLRPL